MNVKEKFFKLGLTTTLTIFLSVQFLGAFAFARPANAQILAITQKNPVVEALLSVGKVGIMTGISHFTRKIAYDTAKYIGSGGKGQSAQFFTNGFGDYLKNTAGSSLDQTIDAISKETGVSLCQFPDLKLQAGFLAGLQTQLELELAPDQQFNKPDQQFNKPDCSWREFSDIWLNPDTLDRVQAEVGVSGVLQMYSKSLNPMNNDFGIALKQIKLVEKKVSDSKAAAELARIEGGGVKPVEGKISNKIKTPSFFAKEEAKGLTTRDTVKNAQQQAAGLYAADEVAILPMALGVFVNTLASTLLNKTLSEGLFSEGSGGGAGSSAVTDFYAENLINNRKAVEKAFNFLFTAVPSKQLSAYDILNEFTACPDIAGLNNCVIDNDFREAIERANLGASLTIKEALEEGLLKRDWPLYSPLRTADNTDPNCREKGYCYSNIQKLRKVRILPSGFEIAALKSDPDTPWTLGEVVDGFYDKTKPYYKLVNPNWVLRLPQVRCESKVNGPVLETADGTVRRQECVDLSTCITEGPNGECVDEKYYAYCTKEKNTWHIGTNTCEPQYNTCKAYVDQKGTARSYLSRTVDAASCSASEVGCSVFSLERDGSIWSNSGNVDLARKKSGQNQVIHFNRNINNQTCPPESDGCTAFYTVALDNTGVYKKTGDQLNLKKAPDYLGCYDTNVATVKVDYPQNKVQLNTLLASQDSACLGYAQVCLEEELGCQLYAPSAGGATVPGIVGANACNSECVGYDAYKQEATQFTKAEYPLYFIPSQAEQCQAEYAGCSEFTNLETEGSEFYSEIKYCEKPTGNNQKTYYSWEGDKTNGYVLRTHSLRPLSSEDLEYLNQLDLNIDGDLELVFPPNSPAYSDDSKQEIEKNYNKCNEETYTKLINGKSDAADPDCRAIYDEKGTVSYRLLSKTITVSDQCQTLRKTDAEFYVDVDINSPDTCVDRGGVFDAETNSCQRCLGGGNFVDGSCVYNAIASESTSCPAIVNNCREFSGNTGNNIAVLNSADFEPGDGSSESINIELEPWKSNGNISIAAESLQVGLNSLQIEAKELRWNINNASTVKPGEWVELTFWTRGISQSVNIDLEVNGKKVDSFTKDVQTNTSKAISVSDSWTTHRVGPVQIPTNITNITNMNVVFNADKSNAYFLDTVRLKKLTDTSFLIKDSWKDKNGGDDVPVSCDVTPENIFPGKALGCTAYDDVDGRTITTTGFEQLCRQEAIGCAPLVDTYNTVSGPSAEDINIYKASCILPGGGVSKVSLCTITYNDIDLGSCNVQIGNDRCTVDQISVKSELDVNKLDALSNVAITKSTVVIPADNLETEPIFLTTNPQYRCSEQHLGCMLVAREEKNVAGTENATYSFSSDVAIKNNPDNYNGTGGILCSEDSVGCGEFKTETGVTYFRDPQQIGNALCVYQDRNEVNGNNVSGWFKKDVGTCSNSPTTQCRADSSEADCGAPDQCINIGKVSCYDNFIEPGGDYGIWSNKSANYQGLVGECPIEANTCSELVDPQDTSDAFPSGKPYYVLFDEQVKEKISECSGGVSLEEGCVLFDRTELPNKTYNSKLTYQASSKVNGKAVAPSGGNNQDKPDTNVILKVDRDRACSEWLSCKTSITQVNEVGIPQKLCVDFRACDQVENGVCLNWKDTDIGKEFLSLQSYQARDTSWYGEEYTGYSLFNKFQITNYDYLNIEGKDYVVYKMDSAYFEDEDNEKFSCLEPNGSPKPDWETSCGFGKTGRCYSGDCVFPVDGPFPENVNAPANAAAAIGDLNECKAYPEKDSPYSPNIALTKSSTGVFNEYTSRKSGFENANVCQDGSCSCEYTKVQYKNNPTFSYWQNKEVKGEKDKTEIPKSICVGGELDGKACDATVANSCGTSGICSIISKQQTHIGFKGYCLEEDKSRLIDGGLDKDGNAQYACLTWLPIEVSASGFDNYNNFSAAGYYPAVDSKNGGEVYCLDAAAGQHKYIDSTLTPKEAFVNISSSGPYDYNYEYNDPTPGTPTFTEKGDTGEMTAMDKYGLQVWTATKNQQFTAATGDQYHDKVGIKSSLVWYVDNTSYFYKYAKALRDHTWKVVQDSDFDCHLNSDGNYTDIEDSDGKDNVPYVYRMCNTLHYSTPIAMSDSKSYSEYSLEKNQDEIDYKQVKRIYFSPFVSPVIYDTESSKAKDTSLKYFNYNSIYLDFDEVDAKADVSETTYKEYPIVGARRDFHPNELYKVYQGRKITNNVTRYVTIVVLEGATKKTVEDKLADYLNATTIKSGKSSTFRHTAIIVEIDKKGKFMLDGKRPFKLLDPETNATGTKLDNAYNDNMIGHSVLASTIMFKPFCTELASVFNEEAQASESSNKAFVNRVWKYAKSSVLQDVFSTDPLLTLATSIRPAGSLNIKNSDLKNLSILPDVGFDNLKASGMPLRCSVTSPAFSKFGVVTNAVQCDGLSVQYGASGYSDELKKAIFENKFVGVVDKLFAKVVSIVKKDSAGKYKKIEGKDNSQSIKTTYAPRIYSINPANCFDQTKKGCGVGDWDNITINGRNGTRLDYDGDGVSDEDPLGNGQHEAIIARKAIGTVMNFFAAVDDDQLPIKRVMVDWGDTKVPQNVNRYGLYKNHKPYCQLSDETVPDNLGYCAHKTNDNILFPTVTCNANFGDDDCKTLGSISNNVANDQYECRTIKTASGDNAKNLESKNLKSLDKEKGSFINEVRFGNAPRACQPNYFEYTHSYTCPKDPKYRKSVASLVSSGVISEATRVRLATLNVGSDDSVCVYKPKVQILDNWGYCNGDCGSGDCYGNSLEEGNRQCEYNQAEKLGVNPWTEYQGQIIVIPN